MASFVVFWFDLLPYLVYSLWACLILCISITCRLYSYVCILYLRGTPNILGMYWCAILSVACWSICNVVRRDSSSRLVWLKWPGPRFTNEFSIAIQIRWKFRFSLTSALILWSLQNFVHGTTAVLSWHVQNLLRSDGQQRSDDKAKFPSYLNCGQKPLVKRAYGPISLISFHLCVKFRFTIIRIPKEWLAQHLDLNTTTVLSWHVQYLEAVW